LFQCFLIKGAQFIAQVIIGQCDPTIGIVINPNPERGEQG